ncbi:unnamed protein product [Rotaria sp. Silwood1]|nr:unnamed protein product [Rotaria sp. Silwood1]CAF4912214.1 unnamed protein product [Rotaria sp. Silwood1]
MQTGFPASLNRALRAKDRHELKPCAPTDIIETPLPECQYSDGGRYQGEFRYGKRHGYGVYYYPNKEEWAGKWLNDQTNGRGIRTFPDGSRYEGEEKNAKKHGYGTYCFPNGDIYDGEWVNDKQNGKGTFIKPEGIQYNGYFRNNLKHGYGKMKYADGKIKEGYWKDDKFIDRS